MPKFIEAYGAPEPILDSAAFFVRNGDGRLVEDPDTHRLLAWASRADAEVFASELTALTGQQCHAVPPEPHELAKAKRLSSAPSASAVFAATQGLVPDPKPLPVAPTAASVAGIAEVAPHLQPVTGPVTEAAAKARAGRSKAAPEETAGKSKARAKAAPAATETAAPATEPGK